MNLFSFLTGFRKFAAFILYFAVTTVLMLIDKINGDIYMAQVTVGLSAFMATNIGEHLVGVAKDWLQSLKGKVIDKGENDGQK